MARKTKSPGSGRSITKETYDALYNSYAEHGSIRRAARDANVEIATAKKYINKGTDRFPCIKDRVMAVDQRVHAEQDYALTVRRRTCVDLGDKLLAKLEKEIDNLNFEPSGKYVFGEDGEPVLGPDGKHVRVVDEETLAKVVAIIKELKSLTDTQDPRPAAPGAAVQVNFYETASDNARAVQRVATDGAGMVQGSESESGIRDLVRGEAKRRRVIDITPEDN